jgi:hypothetical protein
MAGPPRDRRLRVLLPILHGDAASPQKMAASAEQGSGHGQQHDNGGEDHEVRVEKEKNAGVVEAPSALQAARSFGHAPRGHEQGDDLPV